MTGHKVIGKQFNSKKCIVCGMDNPLGLKTRFYELDNGEVAGIFTILEEHQSYPGRMHGGVSSAVLDETIGRAIMITEPYVWAVTAELSVKYRQPVPLDTTLTCIGRITRNTRLIFEGEGEILLPDGTVAVTAKGKYRKLDLRKITSEEEAHGQENWIVWLEKEARDPEEIFY